MPAAAPLEAGKARLLPRLHAPEERLVRLVEPGQHVLQHVAVDGGVFWHLGPDGFQLGFLGQARDGDVAALPGGEALLKRRVVERATAPEHGLQRPFLGGRRAQFLLVGLAHARLVHASLFQPGSANAVHHQDCWLKPQSAEPPGLKSCGLRHAKAVYLSRVRGAGSGCNAANIGYSARPSARCAMPRTWPRTR